MNLQEIIAELLNHLRGMWRYRWHAAIVTWLVAIPGWSVVYKMPDIYQASAQVSVDTNSLLPELTQGLTAGENIVDEVGLVSRALLARPNLAEVARKTDLDLRAGTPHEMELLITSLQRRVRISGGRDNVFEISFTDNNRQKATDVVSTLLNIFVESSLGAQGSDVDVTERALGAEIKNHEDRLEQAESDLAAFKRRNLGYMPEDGADYYTRLQTAMSSITRSEQDIRLLTQRRDEVSRQLEGEEPVFGLMTSTPAQAAAGCSNAGNISTLNQQLSTLQVDFTDKHPRIVMLKDTVAALEAGCAEEREEMGSFVPVVNPATNSLDANPVYQNLRLQLSNADVELVAFREELRSKRRQVARLRADVDKIGQVETDLKRLNRDYGVVEVRHQELLRRWETLQSRNRLDPITDQVQFNILEPPFAAATPVAPNRPLLLMVALIFAVGAGGAIAFALNQLNPVFFTRRSVARAAGLPVLGSVSMIMSSYEISSMRRRTFAWVSVNIALFVLAGAVIALDRPVSLFVRSLMGGPAL